MPSLVCGGSPCGNRTTGVDLQARFTPRPHYHFGQVELPAHGTDTLAVVDQDDYLGFELGNEGPDADESGFLSIVSTLDILPAPQGDLVDVR